MNNNKNIAQKFASDYKDAVDCGENNEEMPSNKLTNAPIGA